MQNILPSALAIQKNIEIKMYRTIFPVVVVCGCETWWLTLREERRLCVFENGALGRISGQGRVSRRVEKTT